MIFLQLKVNFKGNSKFYWDNSKFDYSVDVSDSEDGTIGKGIDPDAITFTADYLASRSRCDRNHSRSSGKHGSFGTSCWQNIV